MLQNLQVYRDHGAIYNKFGGLHAKFVAFIKFRIILQCIVARRRCATGLRSTLVKIGEEERDEVLSVRGS
jgi:hypothetical protein